MYLHCPGNLSGGSIYRRYYPDCLLKIMGFQTFYSIMYLPKFKMEEIKMPCNIQSSEKSTNLRFPKPNLDAVTGRHNDLAFELGSIVIPVLAYTLKALQNPHNGITYENHQPIAWFMDYEMT